MKHFIYTLGLVMVILLFSGCQGYHYNNLTVLAFVLITLIFALFIVLAHYSNILRDEVSDSEEFDQNAQKLQQQQRRKLLDKRNPFSLAKVQFGMWTVIISSSYIYLSLVKGDCAESPINKTALVLMGIFAGTAVASTIIDKREISDNRPRHQNSPSQGFFIDILSDETGISLHRFQNFVWTAIAMIVYVYKVSLVQTGCILPELNDTVLALTGISSATYLILRTKENTPAPQDVPESSVNNVDTKVVTPASVKPVNEMSKQPAVS